ncbi:hypothetical protein [Kitasatospora sp. NPDC050543]|uniref:hypothetical protein n=1 Tax=Kitasatospora sp. NPDC050543 TaxID=3364054 RepID=UPI0037AA4E90
MKITTTAPGAGRLVEPEPTAAYLMNRHMAAAREWFPHQYVPFGRGRDFDGPLGAAPWNRQEHRPEHPYDGIVSAGCGQNAVLVLTAV